MSLEFSPLFLGHLLLCTAMTGVILFVQGVHYPLFERISKEKFHAYHLSHTRRTAWVVAPMMLAELATGLGLAYLYWSSPDALWFQVNILFLGLIWISTFCVQMPIHYRLEQDSGVTSIRLLTATNWLRTLLWLFRLVLLLAWVFLASN